MENLFYLILLLALGKISKSVPAFPENTSHVLNQFVIYVSLPATILLKLNGLELQTQLLMLAVIPWVLVLFAILFVRWIARCLAWDRPMTGAVMLCVALGNTSFFGFPAVSIFLGPQYLSYAVIYDQLGTFLALVTFGTLTVSIYGESKKVSFKKISARIISFPPFIAMIAGALGMNIVYPPLILNIFEGLSSTLVPVVTFSVGSALVFRQPLKNVVPIGITLGLKMVVCPLIAFVLLWMMNIKGAVFMVCLFEAGMPPMVMAGVIAAAGNLRSDIATAAIGYGILLSLITLPLLGFFV